jgi:hypothetical protein
LHPTGIRGNPTDSATAPDNAPMARPTRVVGRRRAPALALLAAIGFVVTNVVLIARTPPPGAATATGLAAAYQQALVDQDPDAVGQLAPGLPDDEAAVEALLVPADCGGHVGQVQAVGLTSDTATLLLLDGSGRPCARLPVAAQDGRWVIDPWTAPFHQP